VKKFEPNVSLNDSVRFHIPRILTALYTIRNKRGVGHVGGDVNPNFMDSVFVVSGCDWVMAELVRILHDLSPIEAQKLVASIVTKKIPIVWEVGDVKRVLNPQMSARSQTLILLYHSDPDPVIDSTLCRWVGYSNCSVYASKILKPLHHERLLEYGDDHRTRLSPLGKKFVEDDLALQLT
jgi:hypothetical protein